MQNKKKWPPLILSYTLTVLKATAKTDFTLPISSIEINVRLLMSKGRTAGSNVFVYESFIFQTKGGCNFKGKKAENSW